MCGIAAILSPHKNFVTAQRLQQMTNALTHRGPDGEGCWMNTNGTVALGHRRLSILDLSEAGSQPLYYLNRYTIVHNGEIYNYLELKETLLKKGYQFHSQSDTEVIVAAYDCYKEECVHFFEGMFAFVIWDEQQQQLFAARDRFGEKPLYYFHGEGQMIFASEFKALWSAGIPRAWNHLLLLSFLANGHTQNAADPGLTFYKDVYSLPPGHYATYQLYSDEINMSLYWDLDKLSTVPITEAEAIEKFEYLFSSGLQKRLRSDVPVGSSLSGGLDSASIVATGSKLHASHYTHRCFTASFPGFEKDEVNYAGLVAQQFHLQQFITEPSVDRFINDFDKLCYHQEQPFSSASVYAQYKVMELAKQHGVTVLLDGQGADEILAGYTKYVHWYLQEQIAKLKFGFARRERLAFQQHKVPFQWGFANYMAAWLPLVASSRLEEKERKNIFHHPHIDKEYAAEHYDKFYSVVKPPVSRLNDILYFNTMQQGLGELLHYADRNSMAHGREVRLPFLNHELVEFIFTLSSSFKMHSGFTKYILRKTTNNLLPKEIVWRTEKVGYEPPQKQWLEHKNLQELIMVSREKLIAEKILKPNILREPIDAKAAYESNNFDWRYLTAAPFF
ncbi:MAG TPA: asparagine synthase (glutamine-hydrolyzing) [Lacibacter sp.]|nr:asparagine synthase (glutamine-hydrolyzing) [Lacibacter sp.]